MKNAFEVCQWLIMERPDILAIVKQMHDAMNASLDLPPANNIPTAPMPKSVTAMPVDDEKSLIQLWHEEIKCIFLRCRTLPDEAIESLIKTIFNYDLYSNSAEEVICHSKRVLTDFCSKLNKKLMSKFANLKKYE